MTDLIWKFVFASAIGTSHERTGAPCQDSSGCFEIFSADGSSILLAAAADGAGSASKADVGSMTACSSFFEQMKTFFKSGGKTPDVSRDFIKDWIERFRIDVIERAESEGLRARDFASTFLAAVIADDCAAFIQIGDGAVIVASREEPNEYRWIFWPQQGEYANQTNFITDEKASDKFEFKLIEGRIDEAAIFTDGLQNIALHHQSRTAHKPFFSPMFARLRALPAGHSSELSSSLASFLNSQKVNDCTDDDKTLILAARL